MQVGSKSTSQQLYVKLRLSCLRYAQRPLHQRLLVVLLAVAFVSFALTSYHSQSNPLPAPPHFSYQPVTMLPKMMYGLAWKKERTTRLVLQALSAGFRAFDVAGQPKHYNEPGLGEAIAYALKTKLIAKREDVFLQTKFTFFPGQDPNDLPYDASLPVAEQFKQSFPNSLKNLQTSYVDSLVLHGPYTGGELVAEDWAVWREMEAVHAKGLAKVLGVSNVNARQLELLVKGAKVKPTFVQNRCYANQGWDSAVRAICKEKGIIYQGFSLLTANFHLQSDKRVIQLAAKYNRTIPQVFFQFAIQLGMLPLTGTTREEHMKEDLAVLDPKQAFELTQEEVQMLEVIDLPAKRR